MRCAYSQEEPIIRALAVGMAVQPHPQFSQKFDITPGLLVIRRILIIDIQAIQAIVFQQFDGRFHKPGSKQRRHNDGVERRGVCPTSDAEQHLQVSVRLFEIVNGFEVSVQVVAAVVPRVTRVMYVLVSPYVGQEHLASVRFKVCKCIKDMTAPKRVSVVQLEASVGRHT